MNQTDGLLKQWTNMLHITGQRPTSPARLWSNPCHDMGPQGLGRARPQVLTACGIRGMPLSSAESRAKPTLLMLVLPVREQSQVCTRCR